MLSFPSYIWCPRTKTVLIYKTKQYVRDDSEFGNKEFKVFNEFADVKRWMNDLNLKGSAGIRLFRD
mgnify:CR=1 FL=1